MAKRAKIAVFNLKKGIFIAKKTKAFNWTAKLSINVSEKNLFGKLWPLIHRLARIEWWKSAIAFSIISFSRKLIQNHRPHYPLKD
jgi:hypothetical protein